MEALNFPAEGIQMQLMVYKVQSLIAIKDFLDDHLFPLDQIKMQVCTKIFREKLICEKWE